MSENVAFVKSFQFGDSEVKVGGAEGKPIGQVCRELGIRIEGTTFVLNGTRLPAGSAEETPLKPQDELRVQPKTENGVR